MLSPGGRTLLGTLLGQRLQAQPGAKGASWRHTSLRQAPRLRSGSRRGQMGKAAAAPGKDCRPSETQGARSKQRPLKCGACSGRRGSWAGVSTGGVCTTACMLLSTCPGGQDGGGLGGGAAGAGDVGSGRRQAEGCGQRDSSTRARLQLEDRGSLPFGLVPGPLGLPGQSSRMRPGPGSTSVCRRTSRARVTTRHVGGGAALGRGPVSNAPSPPLRSRGSQLHGSDGWRAPGPSASRTQPCAKGTVQTGGHTGKRGGRDLGVPPLPALTPGRQTASCGAISSPGSGER